MKKQKKAKKVWIASAVLCLVVIAVVTYWFQQATVTIGDYTVVYFKNRCDINSQTLPADLESLKVMPCLIRINWRERFSSDLEQEYCYLPDRGTQKSRLIHKSNKK